MNSEFFEAIELIETEKGIPREYMYEKVEAALLSAYKREFGSNNSNIQIDINPDKRDIKIYQTKEVVENVENPELQISLEDAKNISKRNKLGGICKIELKPKTFRRLSASNAKQVIIQAVREAERGNMIKEYESKREEIITAVVQKVDPTSGNVTVDTGTSYATLLKNEQIPGETFKPGDHIKVFVMEVKKESRGPIVTLSRTHPGMVKRLFELEVPELQDGTVVIRGVIREAGSRTKMAVESRDPNVDPIGACIGNRSIRINDIIDELRGEKIDIIQYSDTPEEFISAALAPAEVENIVMLDEKSARAFVSEDQLSLAIGKEGQNVRLAARLTGIKIDIKTVEE